MVGRQTTMRRPRLSARAGRVGAVVGLATGGGVVAGVTAGPEAGIAAASAVASAVVAIIGLWQGEGGQGRPRP